MVWTLVLSAHGAAETADGLVDEP